MLVSDVIATAQELAGVTLDADVWLRYINMAMDDLTPAAKILCKKENIVVALTEGTGTISIVEDDDLSRAYEILNVYSNGNLLRRLSGADMMLSGWKCDNFTITLQKLSGESTKCAVEYYLTLKHVSNVADDIESAAGLPRAYHHLVVLYCVSKAQHQEGEFDLVPISANEYILGKTAMATARTWNIEPNNRAALRGRRWRDERK